jgi:hypothetical protein
VHITHQVGYHREKGGGKLEGVSSNGMPTITGIAQRENEKKREKKRERYIYLFIYSLFLDCWLV